MCDTFAVIKKDKAFFSKNSDRSPNEPQVIEFIASKDHEEKELKLTYMTIEQVKHTNSILISRPSWLWGAEMGVNEYGVCIGNEAIFTHRSKKEPKLIGMDLLRLALERSKSAKEATEVIINLLKKYNQGGNCAYDHTFLYDNSFLIMDYNDIYILETFGQEYKLKKESTSYSISNAYTLNESSFKENKIMKYFSKASVRRNKTLNSLNEINDIFDCFKILRSHDKSNEKRGTVSSVCMHAGKLIGDHTTSSLVIELDKKNKTIHTWFTGTSTPCQSLFKHYKFGDDVTYPVNQDKIDTTYWYQKEYIFRNLIEYQFNKEFLDKRDKLERDIYKKNISLKEAIKLETELYKDLKYDKIKLSLYNQYYWQSKTNKLMESSDENA